jgi:hypothetical protein
MWIILRVLCEVEFTNRLLASGFRLGKNLPLTQSAGPDDDGKGILPRQLPENTPK